jgi:hypothetical protein
MSQVNVASEQPAEEDSGEESDVVSSLDDLLPQRKGKK